MAASNPAENASLTLDPMTPFDFGHSLWFLRGFIPCSGDHLCSSRTLTTGGYADRNPFVARVSEADGSSLAVEVTWLDRPGEIAAVEEWLTSFLSLGDDLTELYETARSDPSFETVVENLFGYHHVRFSTPFEAACWAALSQRTPMRVANGLKRDLVETYGQVTNVDGVEIPLFPTPGMVREAGSAVRDVIGHERKARTVIAATEAFTHEDLSVLDDAALRARLRDVWGFGDWSSEFIALRGFGRLSDIPRTERRLREAVAELYDLDEDEATDSDLDRLSEPYAPLEGYWAHYIRVWAFRKSLDE